MHPTVGIAIANYKQDKFLLEAIESIKMQTYPCEIHVYNDLEGVGSGEAFNRAIAMAKEDIIVLLCADDVFTDKNVISDIVEQFDNNEIIHVSRWYHQFVDGDTHPVRAWRGENVVELANNPSGLAFRRGQMARLTNKMFVEAPEAVSRMVSGHISGLYHGYTILRYDTVAVRVHKSTARSKDYYKKMWTGSVVKEWAKLGWKTDDFTHLIQVANYYSKMAVLDEAKNFVIINRWNLLNPVFYFFVILSITVPHFILIRLPDIYRNTWGRWTTREVKRER